MFKTEQLVLRSDSLDKSNLEDLFGDVKEESQEKKGKMMFAKGGVNISIRNNEQPIESLTYTFDINDCETTVEIYDDVLNSENDGVEQELSEDDKTEIADSFIIVRGEGCEDAVSRIMDSMENSELFVGVFETEEEIFEEYEGSGFVNLDISIFSDESRKASRAIFNSTDPNVFSMYFKDTSLTEMKNTVSSVVEKLLNDDDWPPGVEKYGMKIEGEVDLDNDKMDEFELVEEENDVLNSKVYKVDEKEPVTAMGSIENIDKKRVTVVSTDNDSFNKVSAESTVSFSEARDALSTFLDKVASEDIDIDNSSEKLVFFEPYNRFNTLTIHLDA